MSKQRVIKDEIWDDEWFYDLDPSEKLVWMFLLTNTRANITGIYKINVRWIANLTGFDKEVVKNILSRFVKDGKIVYENDWLGLVNFHKHLAYKNPSIAQGIRRMEEEMTGCPPPVYRLYLTLLNSTLPYLSEDDLFKDQLDDKTKSMYKYQPVDEDGNPIRGKGKKKTKKQNAEIIKTGLLFERLAEQSTGVKPDLTKAYFIIKNAKEKQNVEDFEALFRYFFADDKLTPEQKVSLAFVCSPSYITKWKVHEKNKAVTQSAAAGDIRL